MIIKEKSNEFVHKEKIFKEIQDKLETGSGFLRLSTELNRKNIKECEELFFNFCGKVGTPLSQNANGDKVLSILDQSFGDNDPRTRGPNTNKKLSFHTDRCDVIAFLCLQHALTGGENQIVHSQIISKIIMKERPDLFSILSEKFPYKTHTIDPANPLPFCEQPIFSYKNSFFACSYLRVLIDRADKDPDCPNLNKKQIEALDFLDLVCEREELQTKFTLKRGDILFLNNWTTLHRRTAFEDFPEPEKKRHFLRIWLSVPNSRPIDEAFLSNFGSVKAGAVRGGIKKTTL